jgi:hypothetical protein
MGCNGGCFKKHINECIEQVAQTLNNTSAQFASHPSAVVALGLPVVAMFGFIPGIMMGLKKRVRRLGGKYAQHICIICNMHAHQFLYVFLTIVTAATITVAGAARQQSAYVHAQAHLYAYTCDSNEDLTISRPDSVLTRWNTTSIRRCHAKGDKC